MHRKKYVILFSILTSWFMLACSPAAENDPSAFLTEFYAAYIKEISKFPPDWDKIEALQQNNCSNSWLQHLETAELEADPFLNVQDLDESWLKSLQVSSVDSDPDLFNVCLEIPYDQSTHCVQVRVKEQEGSWKIDEVLY